MGILFSRMSLAFRDFLRAFMNPEAYAFWKNPYIGMGFLWGIPIPITSIGLVWVERGGSLRWSALIQIFSTDPWQWWFAAHPLLFAVVFGAYGTLVHDRERTIVHLMDRLKGQADTDGLTGLYNHRFFWERLRNEAVRSERTGRPLGLLFVDVNRFKQFNDRYGHLIGDRVLAGIACRMKELVRPYDVTCRYGGDEFTVILPDTDETEAIRVGERVSWASRELPDIPETFEDPISLSVGVAVRRPGENISDWVSRSDLKLYESKQLSPEGPASVQRKNTSTPIMGEEGGPSNEN